VITIPEWARKYRNSFDEKSFTSDEEMMNVAIELSKRNVAHNTGGPFGCAIFEKDKTTGRSRLFSVGTNRVVSLNNSTLHGEMVAIQFAQKKLRVFSLSAHKDNSKEYCLYTSCEPCAMCLGGTLWSGVSKMVCAATKADAEAIGFNEGPVFPESYRALKSAGVEVLRNVLRDEGAKVLQNYGENGVIYNG
jgi:tRNA(Arg) A34 adenosine deaminase TadA